MLWLHVDSLSYKEWHTIQYGLYPCKQNTVYAHYAYFIPYEILFAYIKCVGQYNKNNILHHVV